MHLLTSSSYSPLSLYNFTYLDYISVRRYNINIKNLFLGTMFLYSFVNLAYILYIFNLCYVHWTSSSGHSVEKILNCVSPDHQPSVSTTKISICYSTSLHKKHTMLTSMTRKRHECNMSIFPHALQCLGYYPKRNTIKIHANNQLT